MECLPLTPDLLPTRLTGRWSFESARRSTRRGFLLDQFSFIVLLLFASFLILRTYWNPFSSGNVLVESSAMERKDEEEGWEGGEHLLLVERLQKIVDSKGPLGASARRVKEKRHRR